MSCWQVWKHEDHWAAWQGSTRLTYGVARSLQQSGFAQSKRFRITSLCLRAKVQHLLCVHSASNHIFQEFLLVPSLNKPESATCLAGCKKRSESRLCGANMLKGRGFGPTVCLYFIMVPPLIHFAGNHPSSHCVAVSPVWLMHPGSL